MNKKTLLTCALVAAGIISQASADNVVYITGSTAFRASAFAVMDSAAGPAGGGVFDIPGTTVGGHVAPPITLAARGGSAASGNNAGFMLFHGNIGGTATYLDCAWSGSEAGIAATASFPPPAVNNDGSPLLGVPEIWLKADGTVANNVQAVAPTAAELENNGVAATHVSDLALADTSQASSDPLTQTTPFTIFGADSKVCVVTFTWAKNNNSASGPSAAQTAWGRLSNVSTFALLNEIPFEQTADVFTGQPADVSTFVYLVGRNKGSGTRANMVNDTTYGIGVGVNQFGIGQGPDGGVAGNNPNGALGLWPALDGNGDGGQDNGYESGGSVATALGTAGSTGQADPINGNAGWLAIGYLGVSDAITHNLTVANWLTENGVFESDAAITQGQYSYWGYEHLYGRPGLAGFQLADGNVFFNSIKVNVANAYLGGAANDPGIPLTSMDCSKPTDFSAPAHN